MFGWGTVHQTALATRWTAGDGCQAGSQQAPGVTPPLRQEAPWASLPTLPSEVSSGITYSNT